MLIRKLKITGMSVRVEREDLQCTYSTVDESFVQLKVQYECAPYRVLRTVSNWFTSSEVTCYDFAERDRGRTPSPPAPCSIGLEETTAYKCIVTFKFSQKSIVTYGPDSARLYTNKTNSTSYPSPQVTRRCRRKMFTKESYLTIFDQLNARNSTSYVSK
jgi:hypothetical protein